MQPSMCCHDEDTAVCPPVLAVWGLGKRFNIAMLHLVVFRGRRVDANSIFGDGVIDARCRKWMSGRA
jgi:hypothetical protein